MEMYKLYGFSVSNYYNMVKLALLKKGLAFEHVETMPSGEEDYLQMSPMGKVPCLEVDGGYLIETNVILEYLEDTAPETPLYPADAFARAKVRELMKTAELYLELPGRQLYSSVFFGEELTPELKARVEPLIDKGIGALNRLLVFSPYAAGDRFTYADIVLYYSVSLVKLAVEPVYGIDLASALEGAGPWMTLMEQDPHVQRVNADRDDAFKAFMAAKTNA
jgi:glutathione S-transferase